MLGQVCTQCWLQSRMTSRMRTQRRVAARTLSGDAELGFRESNEVGARTRPSLCQLRSTAPATNCLSIEAACWPTLNRVATESRSSEFMGIRAPSLRHRGARPICAAPSRVPADGPYRCARRARRQPMRRLLRRRRVRDDGPDQAPFAWAWLPTLAPDRCERCHVSRTGWSPVDPITRSVDAVAAQPRQQLPRLGELRRAGVPRSRPSRRRPRLRRSLMQCRPQLIRARISTCAHHVLGDNNVIAVGEVARFRQAAPAGLEDGRRRSPCRWANRPQRCLGEIHREWECFGSAPSPRGYANRILQRYEMHTDDVQSRKRDWASMLSTSRPVLFR